MNGLSIILWFHILCMISTIGVLLTAQLALPADYRNNSKPSRSIAKLANILLAMGLILGLAYYFLNKGYTLGPHYNGVIAMKFSFMLGAGALIGISKRIDNGDLLRWIAIVLFVCASFFGLTLS